jgi:hypothetical protein
MENCLRLDGLEEIWSQTDPFTPEDILELDCYCNKRSIELVPCIATFGHLYDLLRSDSFGEYREMDSGLGETFTWYHRMRHHIINVSDPQSFTLITGILDQYMPLFRSNKISICCDETYDLGKGKSASMAEKMDYGELYLFYVNRLKVYNQTYHDFGICMYDQAKEAMMQVSEDQLKTAVTRCAELFNCLKQNNMGSYADRQGEMAEYYLAARGVALMQGLTLVIKEREYGQNVLPLDAPYELAAKLEYWLMDYCSAWRTGSRESELYRIKEFFGQICSILRKYDTKLQG